jgi:hypothetical protein
LPFAGFDHSIPKDRSTVDPATSVVAKKVVALMEDHSLVEEGSGHRILVRLAVVVVEPEFQD